MFLENFLPTWLLESIYVLTPDRLKDLQVKGIITDLDNTILAWNQPDVTKKLEEWVNTMQANGIQVMILSNNNKKRVRRVADPLGIPYYHSARKPFRKGLRYLLGESDLNEAEVIYVGDQLLTDIWVSNRQGIRSVLVRPILDTDIIWTKLNRKVENWIFSRLQSKYTELKWRDHID
ncbi:YqeG family HAD IIIA-type phosphatase [Aerococcus christensenii]|uniref:YqeG family HAD IIIA-type phosphatase n=1 Tax=Aerococcus christensenii TaxID=87541 RepID=UPI0023A9E9FE|nr:YqeG family HAD IIIA-type phosphatase [Aerococcus christensenii]WEB71436.1 YqeG family HAD IIIA-type phosphatase [Aerococcus christensenii]